jgi:heme-degrading monooxygenase HmoA
MIARIWRGWAPQATADNYQRHYETEVIRHLQHVDGFRGARLLRRDDGQEVMFTSVTFFTSIDAVRGFAGEDYEQAIVEEAGRQALSRWDEQVSHHDVAVDLLLRANKMAASFAGKGISGQRMGGWMIQMLGSQYSPRSLSWSMWTVARPAGKT